MNQQQLSHAIRTACTIMSELGHEVDSVIIIGSQSILGSFNETELPGAATLSQEVDVLPDVEDLNEMLFLSEMIEGVAGELSGFEDIHGFNIDGVDITTPTLPEGWRDRLVPVSNEFTRNTQTGRQYTGWCLDPADLCAAKICAGREKDLNFVYALFDAGLVNRELVRERLQMVPAEPSEKKAQAEAALERHLPPVHGLSRD